jgi:hypothetical protein
MIICCDFVASAAAKVVTQKDDLRYLSKRLVSDPRKNDPTGKTIVRGWDLNQRLQALESFEFKLTRSGA